MHTALRGWIDRTFGELARELRWSYLPPLMVYLAAGISGLTQIVGTFFVKDHLDLSAAFLAGLGFWAGLPWVLKMPLGHLVDLIWQRKALLVWLGAGMIAASVGIMYALITWTGAMAAVMPVEAWYVVSALMAPAGYVVQDVVADAMTVEAVPVTDEAGRPVPEDRAKAMHTTMQTLGRFAVIGGSVLVAAVNIFMFSGVEGLSEAETARLYARIYLMALWIPAISVSGVVLHGAMLRARARRLAAEGQPPERIREMLFAPPEATEPDWQILGGALAFAALSVAIGLSDLPLNEEIVFAGSLGIVLFLIARLVRALSPAQARALIGTAVVVFVFRATPLPGPGHAWFEIDVLGFDEQFLSVLSLITAGLTLVGLLVLRPFMARRPIWFIIVVLSIAYGVLALPNIGLYYGIHEWTARLTGGLVDARFIAIIDTAVESPLGQVAMVPMLAWIARNAPAQLKATFFAVMASFTNLALAASQLGTKYLNELFVVSREVRDRQSGAVTVPADYSELGVLLITVALIGTLAPLAAVWLVQHSRFRTEE
jgi:hypothetical protein